MLADQIRWAYKYRDSPSSTAPRIGVRRPTIPCDGKVPINFAWAKSAVIDCMHSMHNAATIAARSFGSPLPGFVKATIKWLKHTQCTACLSDKDGIFVVVPKLRLHGFISDELQKSGRYRPTFFFNAAIASSQEHFKQVETLGSSESNI